MAPRSKSTFPENDKRVQLTETNFTPEQLGEYLGQNSDIIILGESHTSQPTLDLQAKIFKATKPEMLFSENPPSSQEEIDKPIGSRDKVEGIYGTIHETEYQASKLKIPNKAVDLEHYNSPNSTRLLLEIEEAKGGLLSAFEQSLSDTTDTIEARGEKVRGLNDPNDGKKALDIIEEFISKNDGNLSDFHKNNLREVAEDIDREIAINNGSKLAKISKFFDNMDDKGEIRGALSRRLGESDPVMAGNIDWYMEKLQAKNPDANAVFTVGMKHNKGVEDALEKKGYDVANVKIKTTDNADLDRKVFHNPRPNGREDAEWVVMVYDPDHQGAKGFTKDYTIQPARKQEDERDKSTSQNEEKEISPEMRRAMGQADEVMRGESTKPASFAMNELPQQQRSAEQGSYLA